MKNVKMEERESSDGKTSRIDEITNIKEAVRYCWGIAYRIRYTSILRYKFQEDTRQALALAYLRYKKENEKPISSYVNQELYRLGRELGLPSFYCRNTDNPKASPCVLCGDPGVYIDEKIGRLCRKCGMKFRMRTKKGWKDPYKDVEKSL